MKNLALFILIIPFTIFAQGNVEGYVYNEKNEKVLFANIKIYNDHTEQYTLSNEDGFFSFENLPMGQYHIKVNVFTNEATAHNIPVANHKTITVKLELPSEIELDGVTVYGKKEIKWERGLFEPDAPTLQLKDATFIGQAPIRQMDKLEKLTPGTTEDAEGNISYRGGRPGSAVYYIDGMRSLGDLNIPMSSIYTFETYTGGISAKYGETTSAVIAIETKSYFHYGE